MSLSSKQMFLLFPTPLFTGKLENMGLCDSIEKILMDIRGKAGFGSADYYMTPDNIQTLPEMKPLVDVIIAETGAIFDAMAVKRSSHYITNMWANINHPNHRHLVHVHPNCLLSGILYIKSPPDCAPTIFSAPRQLSKMLEPSYAQKNELNADTFVSKPEKGRMVIWPSFLPHGVDHGHAKSNELRIVIAFNVMIRGLVDAETMRIEFT
jgi:uncharacterized protein (TIGR02466 family)